MALKGLRPAARRPWIVEGVRRNSSAGIAYSTVIAVGTSRLATQRLGGVLLAMAYSILVSVTARCVRETEKTGG